jgi:cobalt-zinc-cadmium efflux system membrane fusion protein
MHTNNPIFPQKGLCRIGFRIAFRILATLALNGCRVEHQQGADLPPQEPRIEGDKVIFPPDALQKASLAVESAKQVQGSVFHLTGRLVWDEDSTVRVFSSVAGRVQGISVALQQEVATGETLATMSSPDFGQAQADASKADADMKLSERTLGRVRDLFEHGAAAKKDVEAAEDDFENRKAELQRALARLKLYGVDLGASVDGIFPLKAPLGGAVVDKNINPGQEVRPDQMLAGDAKIVQPLFVISNPSRLTLLLDIDELEMGHIKEGDRFLVRTKAYPSKQFEGRIQVIGDSLDPQTRTVKARGFVDNQDRLLKAEMYVSVDVADGQRTDTKPDEAVVGKDFAQHTKSTEGVEIPASAVFSKENQRYVFVEKSPGEFQRQAIEADREDDGHIRVVGGIAPGARVVTAGALLLESMTQGAKQ